MRIDMPVTNTEYVLKDGLRLRCTKPNARGAIRSALLSIL